MGQKTQQRQSDRPLEGHGSQPQSETDDAFFAKERERQDPEAEALERMGGQEDAGSNTRGTGPARDLDRGEGEFRPAHDKKY